MEETIRIKPELSCVKIGATPTLFSWSQAYSAGNIFAVFSVVKSKEEQQDISLASIGKEVLDNLEKEYFTLEEKNLVSIKEAVQKTVQTISTSVVFSFIVAVIPTTVLQNVLYVFIAGKGRIVLKRGEKLGAILQSESKDAHTLVSASGFLESNDMIVLETEKFSEIISDQTLLSACQNPSLIDVSDTLLPILHQKQEGDACGIIIYYKSLHDQEQQPQEPINEKPSFFATSLAKLSKLKPIQSIFTSQFNHTKKMFLTIAVILCVVLVGSIFFAIKKQQDAKTQALFEKVSAQAQQKYDEGQGLMTLNKNLARDDLRASKNILIEAKTEFKKDSLQYKKITELLQKIDDQLESSSATYKIVPKQVEKEKSKFLWFQLENTSSQALLFGQDADSFYLVSAKEIKTASKSNPDKLKTILKNDDDWKQPFGFGTYFGNVYLLDPKSNQLLKYVASDNGFGKTSYFPSDVKPDLSNAVSLAIDGSVWILYKDGSIQKFTKGKSEQFKNPSLEVPIEKPLKIATDVNSNNLYILEPKNKRIVVIGKNGDFQSQYQADMIQDAKDFEVVEKEKILYILVKDKVYKIDLG